jgi:F0F1-type ATP synthase delta subunit
MSKVSRRAIAKYTATRLIEGASAASLAKRLAAVLSEAGLAGQVEFLMSDIASELETRGQLAVGRVTSANPLTRELETALKSQIKTAAKVKDVLLDSKIDKSVIGGLRIETSAHVWDSTLSRKLNRLREVF